ncbi:MAG: caspase family protein [Pseudomonadota bacterium]
MCGAVVLMCGLLFTAQGEASERVALVIGIADYARAPLKNPLNDARAMSKRLEELGFSVTRLENPGKAEIEAAIVRFEGELTSDSVSLFYYAGHGIQLRGKNYMVPVDASMATERHARVEGVDVNLVTSAMEYAKSRINFVILDACRDNPFERKLRGGSRGLAAVDAASGTLIAYATAPGSVAQDGDGRNGVYTQALLKALSTPGLQAEQVFKRVRVDVARRTARKQIPWESSSLTGNFVFNPGKGNEPARSTSATGEAGQTEIAYWESIRESDNPKAVKSYLDRYPTGHYVELAELRLAELQGDARAGSDRSAAGDSGRCDDLSGGWRQRSASLACESVVTFTRTGEGTYAMSEQGCGNASGKGTVDARVVAVEWETPFCSGKTTMRLNQACTAATGEISMPANFLSCSGVHPAEYQRLE